MHDLHTITMKVACTTIATSRDERGKKNGQEEEPPKELPITTIAPSRGKQGKKKRHQEEPPKEPPVKSPRLLEPGPVKLECCMCACQLFRTKLLRELDIANWTCRVCGEHYCSDCKDHKMTECGICHMEVCDEHIVECTGVDEGDGECGKKFCTHPDCCGSELEEACINCEALRQEVGYYNKDYVHYHRGDEYNGTCYEGYMST